MVRRGLRPLPGGDPVVLRCGVPAPCFSFFPVFSRRSDGHGGFRCRQKGDLLHTYTTSDLTPAGERPGTIEAGALWPAPGSNRHANLPSDCGSASLSLAAPVDRPRHDRAPRRRKPLTTVRPSPLVVVPVLVVWTLTLLFATGGRADAATSATTPDVSRCPWLQAAVGRGESPAQLARTVLERMTVREKLGEMVLVSSGDYENSNAGVPRLCIPPLTLQDGPQGLAYGAEHVTQLPAPLGVAATFDTTVAHLYGEVLGSEAAGQGFDVVQGPNLNIDRVPQSGRTYEGFGEDPVLVSAMGVADIEGIQETGAMAMAKHFAVYNQETDRGVLNDLVSQRALQELYLPPFRAAVSQAHVGSVMCAYPKLNGTFQCQDGSLLGLLQQWGFDGFLRSDLGSVHDPLAAIAAGTDLIKPAQVGQIDPAGGPAGIADVVGGRGCHPRAHVDVRPRAGRPARRGLAGLGGRLPGPHRIRPDRGRALGRPAQERPFGPPPEALAGQVRGGHRGRRQFGAGHNRSRQLARARPLHFQPAGRDRPAGRIGYHGYLCRRREHNRSATRRPLGLPHAGLRGRPRAHPHAHADRVGHRRAPRPERSAHRRRLHPGPHREQPAPPRADPVALGRAPTPTPLAGQTTLAPERRRPLADPLSGGAAGRMVGRVGHLDGDPHASPDRALHPRPPG